MPELFRREEQDYSRLVSGVKDSTSTTVYKHAEPVSSM